MNIKKEQNAVPQAAEEKKWNINEVIYDFRRSAHLTQNQLADLLGIKHSTYSQMERKGTISVDMLVRIAAVLGRRPEDFFMTDSNRLSNPNPVISTNGGIDFVMTHNDIQLVNMYHHMEHESRVNMMASMTKEYQEGKYRKLRKREEAEKNKQP